MSLPTEKISDPIDGECVIEYRCVKQDGADGAFNSVPSIVELQSETGEIEQVRLEDDSAVEPVFWPRGASLHERFRIIAAIALLAKHFPSKLQRHNTILALAGVFRAPGWMSARLPLLLDLRTETF